MNDKTIQLNTIEDLNYLKKHLSPKFILFSDNDDNSLNFKVLSNQFIKRIKFANIKKSSQYLCNLMEIK